MTEEHKFAIWVVEQLRQAGYEALWAGGCVRDMLLQLQPKDYDVATNARPEQVRDVFGRRRTIPIGVSFGVIAVTSGRGQLIEIATFRQDAAYSDGRRPDAVQFSTAEEDASRRDFTINGVFYDPIEERVIDYVGGQQDLARRVIRAIGDPVARIGEDKLRMLRAVRFTSTFGFDLDPDTLHAVQHHASDLSVVSVERIAAELRRMLVHENRAEAVELLIHSKLLPVIFPEAEAVLDNKLLVGQLLRQLATLRQTTFSVGLGLLLRTIVGGCLRSGQQVAESICRRLKLTNDEIKFVSLAAARENTLLRARNRPWHEVQRTLILDRIEELLWYCQGIAAAANQGEKDLAWCREQLQLPGEQLNPPMLLDGNQLKSCGIPAGPLYRQILDRVRNAQLDGEIADSDQAIQMAKKLASESA